MGSFGPLRNGAGPAFYGAFGRSIQGSHSLSRYGDHSFVILPSVLPATPARRREGFTDLSRMDECDRSHSGQFCLPDKEFRYLRTVIVTAAVYRGFSLQLRLAADCAL